MKVKMTENGGKIIPSTLQSTDQLGTELESGKF